MQCQHHSGFGSPPSVSVFVPIALLVVLQRRLPSAVQLHEQVEVRNAAVRLAFGTGGDGICPSLAALTFESGILGSADVTHFLPHDLAEKMSRD